MIMNNLDVIIPLNIRKQVLEEFYLWAFENEWSLSAPGLHLVYLKSLEKKVGNNK